MNFDCEKFVKNIITKTIGNPGRWLTKDRFKLRLLKNTSWALGKDSDELISNKKKSSLVEEYINDNIDELFAFAKKLPTA